MAKRRKYKQEKKKEGNASRPQDATGKENRARRQEEGRDTRLEEEEKQGETSSTAIGTTDSAMALTVPSRQTRRSARNDEQEGNEDSDPEGE